MNVITRRINFHLNLPLLLHTDWLVASPGSLTEVAGIGARPPPFPAAYEIVGWSDPKDLSLTCPLTVTADSFASVGTGRRRFIPGYPPLSPCSVKVH